MISKSKVDLVLVCIDTTIDAHDSILEKLKIKGNVNAAGKLSINPRDYSIEDLYHKTIIHVLQQTINKLEVELSEYKDSINDISPN